ncbi:MAG: TrkA family potassium uptake protein [Chloroflexota bacterium]
MKIVIVGCGRVGASAADLYDRNGHEVIVLDSSTVAFERLPSTFGGTAIRGDGTDEDVLRRAGAEGADVFLSLTEGDNRNVMAAQLAAEVLGARRVIAKINDPVRSTAYAELGIATVCRTGLIVDAMNAYIGLPPSGLPGLLPPSGHHDTAAHHDHDPSAASAATASAPLSTPVATREA